LRPQRHPGERPQVRPPAAGDRGRERVGGEFLPQPHPRRQPAQQGVVEVKGEAQLR